LEENFKWKNYIKYKSENSKHKRWIEIKNKSWKKILQQELAQKDVSREKKKTINKTIKTSQYWKYKKPA